MPKRLIIIIIVILLLPLVNLPGKLSVVFADDVDKELQKIEEEKEDLQNEYDDLNKKLDDLRSEVSDIENEINNLSGDIGTNESEIERLNTQITKLEQDIVDLSRLLLIKQYSLDEQEGRKILTIRSLYKSNRINPYYSLFSANSIDTATKKIMYQLKVVNEAKGFIANLNEEINKVNIQKNELETVTTNLSTQKTHLANLVFGLKLAVDEKANKKNVLSDETESIQRDLSDIGSAISELSSKQQQLLGQKNGDFSASLSSGVETDDPKASPNYNPGFSPAFAAFSYGAYTHRNGMSQYGAKGRAEDGQDYEEIIDFYYKTSVDEKDDFPEEIEVEGFGNMDFQRYLYGLGEMPDSWPMDALKAQAIAARTYAYKRGGPICITQSCQVFIKSKSDNPPSRWKEAVDETKNMVLDNPKTAQYSSTTGGYINNVGWDGNWPNDSYEKESPWFYKAWYTESYYVSSDKCGRSHPWLDEEEMADILNAWVVWKNGGDTDRISPVTTSCWGGNPYSMDEMANKAEDLDKKYSDINSVSVSYSDGGYTSKIKFGTDKGTVEIDGQVFKTVYNLRAPGYIAIKTPLYNIEKK